MNEPKTRFADRLIAADPPTTHDRYQKEVRRMLDKALTPRVRGLYLGGTLLALAAAGFYGWLATQAVPGEDYARFVLGYAVITAAALVFVAGVYFTAFWRGEISRRMRQRGWAGVGVVYVGLIGWLIAAQARMAPEPFREEVRILGLMLVLFAAVSWIRHRVNRAEMNTAEKLLEIELRLAEVAEQIGRPRPAEPTPTTQGQ
jgi:hypothetical protein